MVATLAAGGCASSGGGESSEVGVECRSGADCGSGTCLPVEPTRRVCTSSCAIDDDCTAGWQCDAFGGVTGSICVCRASASEVCNDEDDDCDGAVDEACSGEAAPDDGTPPEMPGMTDPPPMEDPGPPAPPPVDPCLAQSADASSQSSCALGLDGTLYCWGGVVWEDDVNALDYWRIASEPVVSGMDIASFTDGGLHLCAIDGAGALYCRGNNQYGQLGIAHRSDVATPTAVRSGQQFAQVSAGYIHTCAIETRGSLFCWGHGGDGALGVGDLDDRLTPTRVGSTNDWTDVSAGRFQTCGVRADGSLWCWGTSFPGRIGEKVTSPMRMGTRSDFVQVDVGTSAACAITNSRALYCVGYNYNGELGLGHRDPRPYPTHVGTESDWTDIAAGGHHTCGIRSGNIYCWGDARVGQLGTGVVGDDRDRDTPVIVREDGDFVEIHASGDQTCALRSGGQLYCWGGNGSGEVDGSDAEVVARPMEICATDWS